MGRTREGKELSRAIIEEFHGQICPIETTSPDESIRCSVLLYLGSPTTIVTVEEQSSPAAREQDWLRQRFSTTAATSAMQGSGGIVFFHEDVTLTLYEFNSLTTEFMSRGVQPRGSSGE